MQQKILFLLLILLFSQPSMASFWQKCVFKATYKKSENNKQYIEVQKTLSTDGHSKKCDHLLGLQIVELKKMGPLKEGQSFKVEYNFYNGMGPDGVVNSIKWTNLGINPTSPSK